LGGALGGLDLIGAVRLRWFWDEGPSTKVKIKSASGVSSEVEACISLRLIHDYGFEKLKSRLRAAFLLVIRTLSSWP
jgi:hypothetical protein